MALTIPFYVTRVVKGQDPVLDENGDEELGLVISETVTPVSNENGVGFVQVYTVLWNESNNRAPELVYAENLRWKSVPELTDNDDALLIDEVFTEDSGDDDPEGEDGDPGTEEEEEEEEEEVA